MDQRLNPFAWLRYLRIRLDEWRLHRMLARRRRLYQRWLEPLINEYRHAITLRYGQPNFYYGWRHARRRERTFVQDALAKQNCPDDERTALEIERAVLLSLRAYFQREPW